MISKNKIKYIHSLELKKNRDKEGVFVAEGPKVVDDILKLRRARTIVATEEWLQRHSELQQSGCEIIEVDNNELSKASFLQHPQQVLAVFERNECSIDPSTPTTELTLALDGIQDPGNLGTIIRIADWFGITSIVCSKNTADVYNPKVVQSTMGSIARVGVAYADLHDFLASLPKATPIYGTLLEGDNIYEQKLTANGVIVMGNEGKGISPEIRKLITHGLYIPNYPAGRATADSLNVAVATAIVCSEFRRNLK